MSASASMTYYIYLLFLSQLSREVLVACLPLLVKHLTAKSHVVHSYSANCLEKLFTLKKPGGGAPYVFIFMLSSLIVV